MGILAPLKFCVPDIRTFIERPPAAVVVNELLVIVPFPPFRIPILHVIIGGGLSVLFVITCKLYVSANTKFEKLYTKLLK